MQPLIRLARQDEADAVRELVLRAYDADYEIGDRYRADLGAVRERMESQQVWVAQDPVDGRLLGTVTTAREGGRVTDFAAPLDMDMRMLAVPPAARGRGVARALVLHCMALGRRRGAERLVLHTGEEMAPAIGLYERMGFERLREIEQNFPYPPGVRYDVRVYTKKL